MFQFNVDNKMASCRTRSNKNWQDALTRKTVYALIHTLLISYVDVRYVSTCIELKRMLKGAICTQRVYVVMILSLCNAQDKQ